MLIHALRLVRTFPHICTVLQQFVSSERPRSAPVSGRELLTIGYLQALPWPGFVNRMDSLSQVSTSPYELVPVLTPLLLESIVKLLWLKPRGGA
jgi:hypothetical protein